MRLYGYRPAEFGSKCLMPFENFLLKMSSLIELSGTWIVPIFQFLQDKSRLCNPQAPLLSCCHSPVSSVIPDLKIITKEQKNWTIKIYTDQIFHWHKSALIQWKLHPFTPGLIPFLINAAISLPTSHILDSSSPSEGQRSSCNSFFPEKQFYKIPSQWWHKLTKAKQAFDLCKWGCWK